MRTPCGAWSLWSDYASVSFSTRDELLGLVSKYLYDGPGAREEWLWNQRWLARLRRVRIDAPKPCETAVVDCFALEDLFVRGLERAVVH